MALFKFRFPGRSGDDQAPSAQSPAESVEALRRRARHRLIGAAVLVLAGVVGFPLIFDTQPRPVAVDIPINIPDKAQAKPLVMPAPASAATASAPSAVVATPAVEASTPPAAVAAPAAAARAPEPEPKPEAKVEVKPAPKVEAKPEAKPEAKSAKAETRAEPPAETKHAAKAANDGARAQALLEGKATAAAQDSGRFVVQVGAFSDPAKAREARLKVERAGLKTYTQEVDTKDGKRIRVRVGPYPTRAEADKAAAKIKALDLQAAILAL